MKKIIGIILSMLMIVTLISCGSGKSESGKLATKADGLSIEPGKTKLQDLIDNGFTYKWSGLSEPMQEIEGKKFIPTSIDIMKDNQQYATVGLINNTRGKLKLEECIIGDTRIYSHYINQHQFTEITVKGENYVGLKLDDVKAKFTDNADKLTHEDEKSLVYNDGKHAFDFEFDDQKVLNSVTFDVNEHEL